MTKATPIRYVRKAVFRVTQEELARIGHVSRSRVSKYESGRESPPYAFLEKLRDEAKRRGLPLSAEWFFEQPHAPDVAA
jgi:transcriptional regulator with XRE-family HTH domain